MSLGGGIPLAALDVLRKRWEVTPDYTAEPMEWVKTRLPEAHLWSKQREILESVRDNPNTTVQACHSAGKSWLSSVVVSWWIDSHPPGEAFVVTSAPTGQQVKAILWREISRRHKEGDLRGRTNQTEWYDNSGELVAFGRKPSDYSPTAFQGLHAKYLLVLLDEACGIPEVLWDAASSLASNEHGRILAVGNPDDPQSYFAKVCASEYWNTIIISAFDTPNFTGEDVPESIKEMLVSKRWVEEKKRTWTEASPVYISKVLGQFPKDAEDGLLPYSWANRCRFLELKPEGEVELGLDVAAGGADASVIWARQGPKALRKWTAREGDPLKLADWVLGIILESGATSLKVDSIGVGWGVGGTIDAWHRDGKHDCIVSPVNVSEAAWDTDHFLNLRAEIWWAARERSRASEWDLAELEDDDIAELTAVKYHMKNPRSRIQVEKKSELKKRIGKSPDSADALNLAFHTQNRYAEDLTAQVTSTPGGW